MDNEIEATFLSVDKNLMRIRLKENGFELKHPEYMMRRKTFDFLTTNTISGTKKWGRVRQEVDKVTMTIKEIRGPRIEDTYEIELVVDDFDRAIKFLEECGLFAKAFQENLREVWQAKQLDITIDTWPGLEPFVEIEGPNEKIVREESQKLGFNFENAVFGSIDLVYEKELGILSKEIVELPEITFSNPPKRNN